MALEPQVVISLCPGHMSFVSCSGPPGGCHGGVTCEEVGRYYFLGVLFALLVGI